jgi:hypothetical protein
MLLILRDQGLDLRQLPDLVPQRLLVVACQRLLATSASPWLKRHHVLAYFNGNQGPLVSRMTRLAPTAFFGLGSLRRRLAVRMLAAGRQGGILRRLLPPGDFGLQLNNLALQLGDMGNQQAYNRLSFWRLASDKFFGDPGQHAQDVAEIVSGAKISFSFRGVNDYKSAARFIFT